MNKLNKLTGWAKGLGITPKNLVIAGAVLGVATLAHATDTPFVSYDGTTGAVTFEPATAIGPVIAGVIKAIIAGLALFTLAVGTRFIYRFFKGSK